MLMCTLFESGEGVWKSVHNYEWPLKYKEHKQLKEPRLKVGEGGGRIVLANSCYLFLFRGCDSR